jgi:hypothetical protein
MPVRVRSCSDDSTPYECDELSNSITETGQVESEADVRYPIARNLTSTQPVSIIRATWHNRNRKAEAFSVPC